MSRTTVGLVCPWTLLLALWSPAALAARSPTEQIRQITLVQDMVIGLAPGQVGRLTVAPDVYPDFEPQFVVLNVLAEAGGLLATTGRRAVVSGGGTQFFEVWFHHTGDARRLVRFQYQLAGTRRPGGGPPTARTTTRPLAPGTLDIRNSSAGSPAVVMPVPAFTTSGTAASCALPSDPANTASSAGRRPPHQRADLVVGEFPLVRVGDRQALHVTLVDSVPRAARAQADLGVAIGVFSRTGELVAEEPESPLDGRPVREWVFGTELPRSASGGGEFFVRYVVRCGGDCDTLARWVGRAQAAGPPFTPGLQLVEEDTSAILIGLLVPAVQKIRDGGGGGGGGNPTPPPPPPNT